jgi:phospholipase/carboxylesterase
MTAVPPRLELAGLTARVIGPADAATTVVLMHGFGASGEDLVPLAHELQVPVRYVFPAAPLTLGGMYGDARAWWLIDFERIERQLRAGDDRTVEVPDGLHAVRAQVSSFLDALVERFAIAPGKLVLGGFSQGAMLSLDVGLHRAQPPAGLILMSGTLIAAAEWQPRMPQLAGVPILMSHGRQDPLLPFATSEQLRDQLRAAGADLEWIPFHGGHTIAPNVVDGVAHFLRLRG